MSQSGLRSGGVGDSSRILGAQRSTGRLFYTVDLQSLDSVEAPIDMKQYWRLLPVYKILHEYCDVICSWFSSAGATAPGDMVEGGTDYLWWPRINGKIGYSYSWAWDIGDSDWNQPSSVVRKSIKNGRPAIVGLGWLWHYGVAYKYRYQEFKATPNTVLLRRRWFACNEGWGKKQGAWYSGYDTFLGFSLRPWKR